MSDAERSELYTTEELGCEPAQTPAGGTLSTEETDRLIDQYQREAGTLGPGHWFSAAKVGFHFGVGVAYDDNIRSTTANSKQADEITTLTGGVTIGLGDYVERQNSYLAFDYTLIGNLFATHGNQNSLDQDGVLAVRYARDRMSTEFASHFQESHDPTSDTAQREQRDLYDESLVFAYRYGDKTTVETRLNYDRLDAEIGQSNQQYSLGQAVDYQVFDKMQLGLGLVIGRLDAEDNPTETYEQPLARLQYHVTGKITLSTQVGVDIRERGSAVGDTATPVFLLQSRWTPYDGTTLTLGAFRRVEASESITGDDFTNSTVQFDVRQRFFRQFNFLASATYTHSDYAKVIRSDADPRSDNYYTLSGGANYEAAKYFDVGLFYQRQQNDSTQSAYSYASNRVFLQSHFVY